jgi:hypothetical protein
MGVARAAARTRLDIAKTAGLGLGLLHFAGHGVGSDDTYS